MKQVLLVCCLLLTVPFSCHASPLLSGQLTQGGLAHGRTEPEHQVIYNERSVPVNKDGLFIIGFGRDEEPEQSLTIIGPDGQARVETFKISRRTYQIERINGISQRMMEPSEEDLQRIGQETELASEARQISSSLPFFQDKFIWPVTGRISGVYGSQRIINGEPRRPHYGIDIAATKGTPVIAPAGGIVTLVHAGMFFSGKTLIIDHGFGLSSSFLHLDRILVKEGDEVSQGQRIASVGATGRVTGPHLDWRVNWFQERLDPALLVPPMEP